MKVLPIMFLAAIGSIAATVAPRAKPSSAPRAMPPSCVCQYGILNQSNAAGGTWNVTFDNLVSANGLCDPYNGTDCPAARTCFFKVTWKYTAPAGAGPTGNGTETLPDGTSQDFTYKYGDPFIIGGSGLAHPGCGNGYTFTFEPIPMTPPLEDSLTLGCTACLTGPG